MNNMLETQNNNTIPILHRSSSMMLLKNNTSRLLRLKRNISYDKDCHITENESNAVRRNETWSIDTGRISLPKMMTNNRNMFIFQKQNSMRNTFLFQRQNSTKTLDSTVSMNSQTSAVMETRIPYQISIGPIRSCMKGSRQNDNDNSFNLSNSSQIGTVRHVQIPNDQSELVQIKHVDSYLRYSSDLWYKKKQFDQMLNEIFVYMENDNHPSCKSFGSYLISYYMLRRELKLANHEQIFDAMEQRNGLSSRGFLSKKTYGQFINQLSKNDFDGVEHYVGIEYEHRHLQTVKHHKKVVAYYRMMKTKSSTNVIDDDDEMVASYAQSLSIKDRCWSYIIGTAQHAAAAAAANKSSNKS